jgi:hypothetical protein
VSQLTKLKKATTLSDLADILGYKAKAVSFILYKIPDDKKYIEFEIPKKNGKTRKIKSPVDQLKHLQRRLADLLNNCLDEISLETKQGSLSHGFRKNHSIITNANNHKNKRYVFNIDLKDFFPSINFGRVRGFFIKNRNFSLNEKVATVIAQIACHNNELPQGSPCSPVISNLIGHLLDIRLVNLAKNGKCTYSRYADDLTFSTNKKDFPDSIAFVDTNEKWTAGKKITKEIKRLGYSINSEKTSMQFKTARQLTTGLTVNKKVNIKIEYYKNARAMCHNIFNSGEFYIGNDADSKPDSINQLEGILSYIYQIKRPHESSKEGSRKHNPTAITSLYRKFLFYKHFYSLEKPLLLCEGKTDIIYLKCALKQLSSTYKDLIDLSDGKANYKISFLHFSKNFKDIFSISTGTSGLDFLMESYKKNISEFKSPRRAHPVIIVLDNDDGLKEIKKKLKIKNGDTINEFYHFVDNMYVLIIPKNTEGAIEDLFDPNVLKIKIEGKSFNRNSEINSNQEYGKIVFAEKVISANQKNINFEKFKEPFDRLRKIIKDCEDKIV